EVIGGLASAGADWIQIDEPVLVTDLDDDARLALRKAYEALADSPAKLLIATYFGAVGDNLQTLASLPAHGVPVDLVRAPEQLEAVCAALPQDCLLSLGLADGRNIWKTALTDAERLAARARELRKGPLMVAPSCSLLHVPVDLDNETKLDAELKN